MYVYIYIYIYIYTCMCVYIYIYTYIYVYRSPRGARGQVRLPPDRRGVEVHPLQGRTSLAQINQELNKHYCQ